MRTLEAVEDELDQLQLAYLNCDDDIELLKLESKFAQLLVEATEIDGRDRVAASVTITNWTRE